VTPDIDRILDLLLPEYINKRVLMPHDVARESLPAGSMTVRDHRAFATEITAYVQHHHHAVGNGGVSADAAFGEAKRILTNVFADDPYQEGYNVALQMGLSGAGGGMRAVRNALADQLKSQALHNHKDYVFNLHIDVLSPADNAALARAYFERFGDVLRRFLPDLNEKTFAGNIRAALEYHMRIIEDILRVARKM
jgi:hypothetical protein